MVEDHQIVLVGQVIAEGNRLIPVVAQMRIGTRRPVAHVGDLRIQLMKTETRRPVAHVGAENGGQNIPTEEDPQGQLRQSPSQSSLRIPHLLTLWPLTLPPLHHSLAPCGHLRALDLVDHHSLHRGKDHPRLQEENWSTLQR